MARYEHLPIYKPAMETGLFLQSVARNSTGILLKTMLVFAKEAQAFDNFNSFLKLSNMAVLLGKQSEGWLKKGSWTDNINTFRRYK